MHNAKPHRRTTEVRTHARSTPEHTKLYYYNNMTLPICLSKGPRQVLCTGA